MRQVSVESIGRGLPMSEAQRYETGMARVTVHQGVPSTVLSLLGAGAVILWPDQQWIGWTLMLSGGVLFVWGFKIEGEHWWKRLAGRLRRRDDRWWEGLHTFTIRSFACLVAKVPDTDFESSARAKAVAAEILSYVNSGHMPLAMELRLPPQGALVAYSDPLSEMRAPYPTKAVGPEATILKTDLEGLARARKWELPWPIPPRKTVAQILSEAPNALAQRTLPEWIALQTKGYNDADKK